MKQLFLGLSALFFALLGLASSLFWNVGLPIAVIGWIVGWW